MSLKSIFFKKKTKDVFTPTTAAKLAYVSREKIETEFIKNLSIPGKQIVVFGYSGGGKTTLVNTLLEKKGYRYITISCMKGFSVQDIIIHAFHEMDAFYLDTRSKRKIRKIGAGVKAEYQQISSSLSAEKIEEEETSSRRVVDPPITANSLIKFLGIADCILVIDDFHKVDENQKQALSQVMKLFVDAANKYKQIKIVAIGAVTAAKEVVQYDSELENRVYELSVPLLSDTEIESIIVKGEGLLNIDFSHDVKKEITKYSNQLASICHQLCHDTCFYKQIEKTSSKKINLERRDLDKGVTSYIEGKSNTFQTLLDGALKQRKAKYQNVELIFSAMISLTEQEVTRSEILDKIRELYPEYPQGNLSIYLQDLISARKYEILRYDENSGKYSFSDKFFRAYVIMVFDQRKIINREDESVIIDTKDLVRILEEFDKLHMS